MLKRNKIKYTSPLTIKVGKKNKPNKTAPRKAPDLDSDSCLFFWNS